MHFMLSEAAEEIGVDLDDDIYDWSVKATLVKEYPILYQLALSKQYNKEKRRIDNEWFVDKATGLLLKGVPHPGDQAERQFYRDV